MGHHARQRCKGLTLRPDTQTNALPGRCIDALWRVASYFAARLVPSGGWRFRMILIPQNMRCNDTRIVRFIQVGLRFVGHEDPNQYSKSAGRQHNDVFCNSAWHELFRAPTCGYNAARGNRPETLTRSVARAP